MKYSIKSTFGRVIIASFSGMLMSILLVVVAAFLLQKQIMGIESVGIMNPVIKASSALTAAIIATVKIERRKFLVGAFSGLGYMLLTTMIFAAMDGNIDLNLSLLTDAIICATAGMSGGIICSLSRR